jgi:hypothetical protein
MCIIRELIVVVLLILSLEMCPAQPDHSHRKSGEAVEPELHAMSSQDMAANQLTYFNAMEQSQAQSGGVFLRGETCLKQQQKLGFQPWKAGRPMYVTVGGVEGSGHHLFASALHAAFDDAKSVYNEATTASLQEPTTNEKKRQQHRSSSSRTYFTNEVHSQMWPVGRHRDIDTGIEEPLELLAQMRKNLKAYGPLFDQEGLRGALLNKDKASVTGASGEGGGGGGAASHQPPPIPLTSERVRLFNGGGSHPFGQPRSPYRFPDLVATEQLDSKEQLLDVRAIFFYRNATDAVLSVLRRGFASEVRSIEGGGGVPPLISFFSVFYFIFYCFL